MVQIDSRAQALRVAVFGLGYVGSVTAASLAHLGHRVIGIDPDEHKVSAILEGRAPFYEPGLEDMIASTVAAGALSACMSAEGALAGVDIALLCVGTPSERNGNLSVEYLQRVCQDIAAELDRSPTPLIIAVRSTVFPGTCEEVVAPVFARHRDVRIVSNPEFLREGAAVQDFLKPSLIVVGGSDPDAVRRTAALYSPLGMEVACVSLRTAEMIKYACNAFHAVKVAFANEVGALSARLGVDGTEVMDTLCRDNKLNLSAAYLKPGFAFGGSCLPKDLRALGYRASRLDLSLPLLGAALPSNQAHLERSIDAVLDLKAARLGVFGLAFKEDTDDLRESPVVALLERLIGKGRDVRVFDPHIRVEDIYGTNRAFLLRAIPHISRLLQADLEGLLGWAECVVIAQKPARGALERIQRSGLPLLDLVGCLGAASSTSSARGAAEV
jgi:GDP-mannose 6-dehydrogenase